eukprot:m.120227 g.120227  ORF g.120227 m.120227 type:complete len:1050 (-) comp14350_c1_seq1:98-3247(-)
METTICLQLPPFTGSALGPTVHLDAPNDKRPLSLYLQEVQENEKFKECMVQVLNKPVAECKLVGFLYPPFEQGVKMSNETPCTALSCMKIVGVDIAVVETQGQHVPARQLSEIASIDDEKAFNIDMSARKASQSLVGSKGLILRQKLLEVYHTVSTREFQAVLTYLPYKPLLNAFKGGAKDEPWFSLLTREQLNQALLRTDWRKRQQYLHQKTPPKHDLMPIFNKYGELIPALKQERKLSQEELMHPIYAAKTPFNGLVDDYYGFQDRFQCFTDGILDNILGTQQNGTEIFCAGGTVLACLTGKGSVNKRAIALRDRHMVDLLPLLPLELKEKIKSYLSDVPKPYRYTYSMREYSDSDIDIFIVADSLEKGQDSVREAMKKLRENMSITLNDDEDLYDDYNDIEAGEYSFNIRLFRTANAISMWGTERIRVVQIILICYKNMEEVLQFFDLDCVCVAYNGDNVFALPRSIRALQTKHNFVEPAKLRRWSTGPRIVKYATRGFGTVFSEICRHEPRCDLTENLTKEMALKIAALNSFSSTEMDFGYGHIAFPMLRRGNHLDKYMKKFAANARQKLYAKYSVGDEILPEPMPLTSRYHYFAGNKSACDENIEMAIKGLEDLPPLRFKSADLWESARGNEFLPKCYMCQARIDPVQTMSERPRICETCEFLNASKRSANPNLTNCVAVVTGGRCRIGYATALRLLRLGCNVVITSRFPATAARKYANEKDWDTWKSKLFIFGVDFRHIPSVLEFTTRVSSLFPSINLLVNNAAQTIRRPLSYTALLVDEDSAPLSEEASQRIIWRSEFGALDGHHLEDGHVLSLLSLENDKEDYKTSEQEQLEEEINLSEIQRKTRKATWNDKYALRKKNRAQKTKRDKDGEIVDNREKNTWNTPSLSVDPVEYLEVQFINVHAPWQIIQTLRPCLDNAGKEGISLIVNVTSAEGIFSSQTFDDSQPSSKKHHAHTNMAKAALNMLTFSLASELLQSNVVVVSVDTGWVSQMAPDTKMHITSDPPLTCEDGAARVLDPFLSWKLGTRPASGKLLRHFQTAEW